MQFAIVFLAATSVVLATPSHYNLSDWNQFKLSHNKVYDAEEEILRFQIFTENLKQITEHNALHEAGLVSYKKGVNRFADMTKQEFKRYLSLSGPVPNLKGNSLGVHKAKLGEKLPESIDYRDKDAVNQIKDQQSCGSCWAFSTTGSLESINFLKNGKLLSLSEQNLVDCSGSYGNDGCYGGLMESAFNYIKDNGLETEDAYPYTQTDGTCKFDKSKSVVTIQGHKNVEEGSEASLQSAVGIVGPTSVAVDATDFQFYESGIFETVGYFELNHGVVAIGYGSENGKAYWIVRNSWGPNWGESGYIRIARNAGNQVGISDMACYPVV